MNTVKNPPKGSSIKTFTSLHKNVLKLGWGLMVCAVLVAIFSFMLAFEAVKDRHQGAYFAGDGSVQKASFYTYNNPKYRGEEVKMYLENYFNLMFSFDKKNFKENITKGVNIGGKPAQDQANYYINENYFETMIGVNASCRVEIDSIPVINVSTYPYYARIYARQIIEAPSGEQQQNLWVECQLVNLRARDEKNPYALELKVWKTFNLNVIK